MPPFPPKTTFFAAAQLQIHPARAILDPRRDNLAGYAAPARPKLSKAFRQVGKTWNSRWNGGTLHAGGLTAEQKAVKLLAAHIRKLRGERGPPQERLAELAQMYRTYLGGIETARRNPSFKSL